MQKSDYRFSFCFQGQLHHAPNIFLSSCGACLWKYFLLLLKPSHRYFHKNIVLQYEVCLLYSSYGFFHLVVFIFEPLFSPHLLFYIEKSRHALFSCLLLGYHFTLRSAFLLYIPFASKCKNNINLMIMTYFFAHVVAPKFIW